MQGRIHGTVNHIFSRDPALDRSDMAKLDAAVKAANDGGDTKALPLKNGAQPATWKLVSLTDRGYTELARTSLFELQKVLPQGVSGLFDAAAYPTRRDALRRGLVAVEGARGKDGRPLKLEFETESSGKVLTQSTLDELFEAFGPRLIGELGQRVIALTEVDPT